MGSTNLLILEQYFPANRLIGLLSFLSWIGRFIGFAEIFNGFCYVGGSVDYPTES